VGGGKLPANYRHAFCDITIKSEYSERLEVANILIYFVHVADDFVIYNTAHILW